MLTITITLWRQAAGHQEVLWVTVIVAAMGLTQVQAFPFFATGGGGVGGNGLSTNSQSSGR